MRLSWQGFVVAVVLSSAASCTTEKQQPVNVVQYLCAGAIDESLTVKFSAATQPDAVLLTIAGEQRAAQRVRSASGGRYQGAGVEFWEHHGEARVRWDDAEYTCSVATRSP